MEIYVLNPNIEILGIFQTYEAIIWNPKFHEPGTFKAEFLFSEKMNRILQRGNILYKTDEIEPGIIKRKWLTLNNRGEEVIQIQGYMASRYLNQRIIWDKMIMSGTPEMIMRQMVMEQVISPSDESRKMPLIQLGDLQGYEGSMEKQIIHENLQETLTDISKTSELGYRLRLDVAERLFFFEVYKGTDRTAGTETPCIFTRDYRNVRTQKYTEDETNYRNVCLVAGAGEDENRTMVTVGEATGIARYEMFCNASSLSDSDITEDEYKGQLTQKGTEKLSKFYVAKAFESKINKKKAMPFELGDYVTCTDSRWNITVDTQVKEIEKGFSKKEESFIVTFGDDVPTLISLIKAKE